ncbi:MAG: FAD-binding oxidoreductase [Gammaproteobacteria bacterium]|nr:FAD-binding oxidoreductase [Gammaproteobacteria bacterium]
MDHDCIVIGGGLVGSAVAYGLSRQYQKVAILDGGDRSFRASRGNFGLVWVQGKGWDFPPYAQWCLKASNLWPEFSRRLGDETGTDLCYQRNGGMHFCVNEAEWDERKRILEQNARHTGGKFQYEMLDHAALMEKLPNISNAVVGASYSHQDGHVDPLSLLHALHQGINRQAVSYVPDQAVSDMRREGGEFRVVSNGKDYTAGKVVLCAGLGNQRLGEMVGMNIPVVVERGQLMITERIKPFLDWPTLQVRQTGQGTVQIGDSHEDVGLNDGTDPVILKKIAQRAVSIFPFLARVRLVRAWGALRIMTPDGNPIYQKSEAYPGAYAVTCHSGVTLAAIHAGPVAEWIGGKNEDPLFNQFGTDRFHV